MTLFGLTISRTKATVPPVDGSGFLPSTTPTSLGGWWPVIRESFAGAWQRNITVSNESVLTFAAVYACVSRICMDIGKLRIRLVEQDNDGIWHEVDRKSPYWAVLRKPNRYQTRIQFFQTWMRSKLMFGNSLVLKARDNRGIVVELNVLDPMRVRTLVAPDGSVYYALGADNLASIEEAITVPASEIIHDRTVDLYHPLCGISPISACGLAAMQGIKAQEHAANFFANGATPGGILTTPQPINEKQAEALRLQWEQGFSGDNAGKTAVLGNDFKYQSLSVNSKDAQFIEQLKLSEEMVCTAFGVPAFMVGVGAMPTANNVESLLLQYYAHTLQNPIECIELLLDEGLGLTKLTDGHQYGTEFDLDDLLRMDKATQIKTYGEGVRGGIYAPNEARLQLNLPPKRGGDSPYLQHQDYSLEALAKRDAMDDPFALATRQEPPPSSVDEEDDGEVTEDRAASWLRKALAA